MDARWFGASVPGRAHLSHGEPCQDSWNACVVGEGSVVVVADGMGSKRHALESSAAACEAICVATRRLSSSRFVPREFVATAIDEYRRQLGPLPFEETGTTCAFSWQRNSQEWVIGLCGDCVVLCQLAEEVRVLQTPHLGWLNETQAFEDESAWLFLTFEADTVSQVVLLTDGVSAEIAEANYEALSAVIARELVPQTPAKRSQTLLAEMLRWPLGPAADDMTIGVHVPC